MLEYGLRLPDDASSVGDKVEPEGIEMEIWKPGIISSSYGHSDARFPYFCDLRAEEGVSRLWTRKTQSCTSKGNDSNCMGHRNVTSAYLEIEFMLFRVLCYKWHLKKIDFMYVGSLLQCDTSGCSQTLYSGSM